MNKKAGLKGKISLSLIVAGLLLLALAAGLELSRYPWRAAVRAPRPAEALPDPPPIVLEKEDAGRSVLPESEAPPPAEEDYARLPGEEAESSPPAAYVTLGTIKIPRLDLSAHVLEGTGRELRYGVGHLPGSAAVGAKGNSAVAAHRNLHFRYLNLLKPGDTVAVTAGENTFVYTVYESFEVEPDALWVLDPVENEDYVLTMITCTPYLTSTHRLIVRARLETVNGLTPAEFYGG